MSERHQPPRNLEAEVGALGSILITPAKLAPVAALICAEDFYLPEHQVLFGRLSAMAAAGTPIDLVTTTHALVEAGELDKAGGPATLVNIIEQVPSAANAEYYANIVASMAQRRRLIKSAGELLKGAFDLTTDADETMTAAETAIREARACGQGQSADSLAQLAERAKALLHDGGDRWSTGVDALDAFTGGLTAGTTWVVGGRSRHGKTALSVGMIEAALLAGKKVLNLRYEEIPEAIMLRLASRRTGLAYADAQMRRLSPDDTERFRAMIDAIAANWWEGLDIRRGDKIEQIEARVEAWRPNLVIVDTIQKMAHMHSEGSIERHDLRVGQLTARLAALALRLKCCVVMLSQISRGAGKGMPSMAHLRESGALGEDADTCALLWWPKVDMPQHDEKDFITGYLLDVAKNRIGGRVGRIHLRIDEGTQALDTMPDAQRSVFSRWAK